MNGNAMTFRDVLRRAVGERERSGAERGRDDVDAVGVELGAARHVDAERLDEHPHEQDRNLEGVIHSR